MSERMKEELRLLERAMNRGWSFREIHNALTTLTAEMDTVNRSIESLWKEQGTDLARGANPVPPRPVPPIPEELAVLNASLQSVICRRNEGETMKTIVKGFATIIGLFFLLVVAAGTLGALKFAFKDGEKKGDDKEVNPAPYKVEPPV